jgi:ATP-dependent Lon protease
LKLAGSENPVILLDEIDKIGKSHKGNLQDVLLEVLDPKQNHQFFDHYLEGPLDLSKVLFICTANVLDSSTISAALYDRMEVIDLDGYTLPEKQIIFRKHILPKVLRESGMDRLKVQIDIKDEDLE